MKRKWERYSSDEHETMRRLWMEGASLCAIASALDRDVRSVCSHIHTTRDDFPIRYTQTTEEERKEMVALRESGMTYRQIGEYMGVSEVTARRYSYDGKIANSGSGE